MFVLYAIIASRIQYQACSIEYRASRIENLGAYGTISTTVEDSLQIRLFMQNEPNFPDDLMNVNKVLTKDYEKNSNWTLGENEPKTNPIKANSKPIKCQNEPNTKPIKPNFRGKKSNWGANDRIEQSAIPHNTVSNICRLTIEIIGSTLL